MPGQMSGLIWINVVTVEDGSTNIRPLIHRLIAGERSRQRLHSGFRRNNATCLDAGFAAQGSGNFARAQGEPEKPNTFNMCSRRRTGEAG